MQTYETALTKSQALRRMRKLARLIAHASKKRRPARVRNLKPQFATLNDAAIVRTCGTLAPSYAEAY